MNAKVLKKRHIWTQMEALISMILIPMFIIYTDMFNTILVHERWVNDVLQVLYRSGLIPCISQALFESRVFFLFPNKPSKWVQSHHMYVEYNWNLRTIHSSQHCARQQVQFMYHDPLPWKVCRVVISGFHTALGEIS